VILLLLLFAPAVQATRSPQQSPGIHVTVLSCITGNSVVAANARCRTVPGAGNEGSQDTGLDGATGLAVAGSGTSVYVAGNRNSSLAQLALGPSRTISFGACFTGNTFLDNCAHVRGATANAPEAPISYPTAAAVSPDGRFLYVVSGDFHASVIAQFTRDPISGTVTYLGCLTGDLGAGVAGPGGCSQLASSTREGFGSGLYEPSGLAISRDGTHLYVTASTDASVSAFNRDPATGALSFLGCVTSNPKASACARVPGGGERVLEGIASPVISGDGRHLYAAANRAATVATFTLDASGAIHFAGCVSPDEDRQPCRRGRLAGPVSALTNPAGVIESADGRFVYVTSTYGTIVALKRNRGNGSLKPASCISGNLGDRGRCTLIPRPSAEAEDASMLSGVRTPVLSANGKLMIAPVRTPDGIVELRRNPKTGALAFRGCATGNTRISTAGDGICQPLPGATRKGVGSGFYKTTALVHGPGNLLYAAASGDATISLLRP
jgi:6-phosphogluconolactonase (cycloisomerase 2 family)